MQSKPTKHYGKWRIRWVDQHGQRRSEVFADRKDADFALRRLTVEAEEAERGLRRLAPVERTFDALAKEWTTTRAARKRSLKSDQSFLKVHLLPTFAGLKLSEIGPREVERFKAARTALHPNTVNHHLSLLISMLRHAHDIGWLATLPKITKYSIPSASVSFRYLRTTEEVRRFLSAAREHGEQLFAFYATAVFTGMRAGELAGLRWDDVDFTRGLVTVQRSYDGPTKNGEARHVPILEALAPILREWKIACPPAPEPGAARLVFPTATGTMRQKSDRLFQETLQRVVLSAGFRKRYIGQHSLRHTFASHWMMQGGDIFRLQRVLGHKTPKMTQRYAHLAPEAFIADRARLNELLPEPGNVVPIAARKPELPQVEADVAKAVAG
ncbi:MAG: putative phage integrase [Limisphaerales bacterium]|nr:MAG: putative phage integrase [Limisphaerales bacterium]